MIDDRRSHPSPRLPPLRAMFEARKQVFVDLLQWDVPVLEGRYEVDQFDDEHADLSDRRRRGRHHLGSAPAAADDAAAHPRQLFPELCAATAAARRRLSRDHPLLPRPRRRCASSGAKPATAWSRPSLRYALENGIATYTGVAEMAWLQQILAFGWRCRPLGLPRSVGGRMLGALRIEIAPTPLPCSPRTASTGRHACAGRSSQAA